MSGTHHFLQNTTKNAPEMTHDFLVEKGPQVAIPFGHKLHICKFVQITQLPTHF